MSDFSNLREFAEAWFLEGWERHPIEIIKDIYSRVSIEELNSVLADIEKLEKSHIFKNKRDNKEEDINLSIEIGIGNFPNYLAGKNWDIVTVIFWLKSLILLRLNVSEFSQ